MSEPNSIVYVKRDADEGTPAPVLWMLIEYRTRNNRMKNYEVINAKDVAGNGVSGGRTNVGLESMHTGKLINVKKDTGVVQATIVTISDDKNFLNKELKDLLQMEKDDYDLQSSKRRKRFISKVDNVTTQLSSSTSQSSYARWNASNSHEQSSTVENGTAMNKQSVIKSNPNVQNYPPMTFDQQTQTDFKAIPELTSTEMRFNKILTTQEEILRDVHTVTEENHNIKQQVASLRVELAEIKTLLNGISERVTHQNDGVHSTSADFNRSSSSMLNSTQTSTVLVATRTPNNANPPRILNLSHQSNYNTPHSLNYNSISIEPVIEASNDSNFSYSNHSRLSHSASNQSIYQADTNHNDSAHLTGMKHEYTSNNTSKNADSFADDEGDPNDEVILGANNTTVPRSVLVNINWNSHTAATRRLLRAKFSREILATHSLTGKPSPAFIESQKPTKHQLNPKIIADIVHYVSKRCKVSETSVRSSITTKCADENKMMRQRNDKNSKSLGKIENKENVENGNQTRNNC